MGVDNKITVSNEVGSSILGILCILVLCGILVAGLWPFHAPTNAVTWLQNANGLRVMKHGTILSSGKISASVPPDAAASLEIWLQPDNVDDSSTILAFYAPENPLQFALHQSQADLEIQAAGHDRRHPAESAWHTHVDDIFHPQKPLLITIASDAQGTAVYVDGALAQRLSGFRLPAADLSGQLVLGTSPVVNDTWTGVLLGLAIYAGGLSPAQVLSHYQAWLAGGQPRPGGNENFVGLYLFDERHGAVIYNHGNSPVKLLIPERYMIVREKLLEPPWSEFGLNWGYWKNVGINIAGFIPLGFCFCAYLTLSRQVGQPARVAVLLGGIASLTIEILQAFLPTRDSGMTDIITNTLGTYLGVLLYRWKSAVVLQGLNRILSATVRSIPGRIS